MVIKTLAIFSDYERESSFDDFGFPFLTHFFGSATANKDLNEIPSSFVIIGFFKKLMHDHLLTVLCDFGSFHDDRSDAFGCLCGSISLDRAMECCITRMRLN